MNFKMVVTDLDGTLLNSDKKISEKDVITLNKLHDNGVKIVIATGRNYFMAKKLIEQIKNINPVILANNGAVIRQSETDELIEYNYLDTNVFEEIYNRGLKYNLNPVLHVDEYKNGYDIIYEHSNFEEVYLGYVKKGDVRVRQLKYSPKDIKNILSVCYLEDYSKLSEFCNEMNLLNYGQFNSICNRNIGERALLEFLHVDGCKWRALKKYIEMIDIKPEEIIAFGDDNNDIELIANSGMGISMKNGTESVIISGKRISEYDNNNSGVSHELINIFNIGD